MAAQTIKKIFRFYLDGFRSMTVGKTLYSNQLDIERLQGCLL